MLTPKAEVIAMLESMADGSTLEDIQYHLYVLQKVRRGLRRANDGALSHSEARSRLVNWLHE